MDLKPYNYGVMTLSVAKDPASKGRGFHIAYTFMWNSSWRGRFTSLWSPKRVSALQRNELTVLSLRYGHLEPQRTAAYNDHYPDWVVYIYLYRKTTVSGWINIITIGR